MYEFYTDAKYYYMVTEYVDGGELFDEIQRRKAFSEEMAADITSQLLSSVVYCHERKIVHRDLKPENILMSDRTDRATIKIADFGLATVFVDDSGGAASNLETRCGTPGYTAPEVLMKHKYGAEVDVWR